jgi:dCTP diphosphatase
MEKDQVLEQLRRFVAERDWKQFHTPENLAKSISIEAAELLELFQWGEEPDEASIKDEIADVLTYCILLADHFGLDPYDLVIEKLEKTKQKYPVEKSKGKSDKYDRL